ncbi:DUF5305 domain-containing protein [Halobacillus litoralis]|uniref:DUF5305 family protein n=1 Tax=Halobacillus litoralis TaxID=45668 RepID=UPI001CD73DBA|nr:DUF5305 family protein [Halobacillus litoralis]MCA0971762.1 DUF5305 domain-containing protein [Halobacillus litoralis]
MNSFVRYGIIVFLSFMLIFSGFKLYEVMNNPKMVKAEDPKLAYDYSSNIDYAVNVTPNDIYESSQLEAGQDYFVNLIDDIETNFHYQWNSQAAVNLEGTYSAKGVLQAFIGEGEDKEPIWTREYALIPEKTFSETNDKLEINEPYQLDLQPFYSFIQKLEEQSDVDTNTTLTVYWDVNVQGDTEFGGISESSTSTMTLPLYGKILSVGGSLSDEGTGDVGQNAMVKEPGQVRNTWLFISLIVVSLAGIISMLRFTEGYLERDSFKKDVNRISKKFGSRLVQIDEDHFSHTMKVLRVQSFEDIVRVSDDLVRPILYKKIAAHHITYYVLGEDYVYSYDLQTDADLPEEFIEPRKTM